MKKLLRLFLAMAMFAIIVSEAESQVSGTIAIPSTNYPTISVAIDSLNAYGVGSGGVAFNVAAGYTETLANKIITASGTSANQIIFQKSGSGANPLITAGVGVSTTLDGIIILSGADYITFNGIDLQESSSNTTTTTQMEWGYALLKVDGTNGSQNNTIKNCVISLNKTNTNSKGIHLANHTTASTGTVTVTAFSGTNSENKINGNTIRNCYIGINVAGFADATPYALYDHYNQIGYEAGNTIRNFGGGSSTVYGIYAIYQDSLAVNNNDIAGGTGTTTTQYGIFISICYNSSILVYNNTVSDTTSTTTSATYGIALNNAGYNAVDNTVIVKRNTVQGMTSTAATSAILYGYYIYYTTSINLVVDSNKFINNKWGGTTQTATGTIYGFYIYPYTLTPPAGSVEYITNNYIAGNKRTQSTVGTGTLYGMYIYYGQETVHAYNNIIENDTLATTTSAQYYMYVYNYYSTTVNYYNNIIRNIYKPTGSTGALYGFYISNAAYTGTFNFYNNSAYNFVKEGGGAAIIYGIYNAASSVTKNFYNNKAYNLYTTLGGSVYGIYQSSGTNINFYKNQVYNLRTSSGFGYGIYIASGTTNNIYNNYISDIRVDSLSSTLALIGMYIAGGTTNNVYYNTIYLNSVSHLTGTIFGTAALYASTTPTVDLRNNIIVNASTPGQAGGYTTAYYRSSTTLSTYASTSNYNLFYSGTPDTNKVVHFDGTNKYQTLSEFKGYVSPRDANSVTENPPFVNVSTPPYDLHLNATVATQCESGGATITTPAITDDYDGQARYPNPGYPNNPSYPASAPDIGADEFGGIPADFNPPTITYTPLLNTTSTSARTITATITDGSGVPTSGIGLPVLYWRINAGTYSAATATSLGSNQYQFTFGSGVITGDVVYYYVCAQDGATPPNVGSNPSVGAGGFTANPPAAATPPTTPNSYTIAQSALTGDYTVGLTMFNTIAGRNISFERVVTKVIKEVPVDEPPAKETYVKGQEPKKEDDKDAKVQITGKTKMVEVEEVTWVPMENGRKYEGDLYIKKAENPNFNYPMGVNGIYATITAAIADLNLRGVSGATRFLLNDASYTTGETYPLVVNIMNESKPTATNTVTIKPNTGVTASITGDAPAARIFTILNSYVSIDGSNTVNGTTRNLTITNTSVTTPQVLVVGSTGTTPITNVTIKNTNFINGVTTSSAVIFSDGATPGTAGWFNNLTFQNNSIKQAYIGLYTIATISAGNGSGLNILNNDIGDSTLPVRLVSVYVQGIDGATISGNNLGKNYATTYSSNVTGVWFATGTVNSSIINNTISDITATAGGPRGIAVSSAYPNANINITGNTITNIQTAGSSPPYGIYVFSTTSGVSVKKNKIGGLLNTNTGGYGARGINVATTVSPSNIEIVNNFVWNIVATSDASVTYWGIGIAIDASVSGVTVYFNSVNLYGSYAGYSSATVHTAFYNSSGAAALNVRDNIFVNSYDNTSSTTDKSYSVYSAAANTAFTDINYNDYYVSGTQGVLGYLGGDQATLAAWKTATGKDQNSINGDPVFVNDSDLHISLLTPSPVGNAGQYIASVPDDIDGNTRSLTSPDIGADEYVVSSVGPLTGIKYIPGDYPTIKDGIIDLDTQGVGPGGVTFKVAAGKVDTAANVVITTTGTASNPIVFEKNGAGANPVIVAGVGTGTLDGVIKFEGVDYITFNGIDIMENPANTTTTTQMEWGYALLKVDGMNGSQNNTIKNCSITLNKTNTATYGIYSANHTLASSTGLTVTAFSGTNSNNKFYGNSVQNCYSGIYVGGFADAVSPYAYYDHFNDLGSQGGNTVRNFGGGTVATYGIYTLYQDSIAVSNNNVGGGTGTAAISYGINIYYGFNSSVLVYNNTVSDTTAATTTATYGIYVYYAGRTGVDNTVIIKRNTVQGMTATAVTSGAFYGYYLYYIDAYNLIIDSNKLVNNKWGPGTTTNTGAIYGMYIYPYTTAPLAGSTQTISNNYIAGNKRLQSVVGAGTLYGMYIYYGNQTVNAYNNIIENDTLSTTTGTSYYMYVYNYYAATVNYYNNKIQNIYRPSGTGGTYGYYISNAAYTGTFNFYDNTANNFNSPNSASLIYGIYNASSAVTKNFYNNTAYSLKSAVGAAVYGIYQSSGTTVNYYKNSVYDLRSGTGIVYGLYIASGTTNNIYNNYISDIRSDSSINMPGLYGMYIAAGTTNNVYYNTIYLNAVSTGATFGSSALYASTTPTVELKNNIFVNNSTPGTTGGYTTAYQRSSTTLSTYSPASDRNLFYAGTPGASNLIFYDGTNMIQTLPAYKAFVTPIDANSVTENPPFVNVTTRPYDLHINATVATQLESGGATITTPAITDDYDGQPRYPNTGYPNNPSYPATAPDIGADEFGGIPIDLNGPNITYTPLLNTPSTSVRTLIATITDGSGVPTSGIGLPVLYWRINAGTWTAATATSLGSNQYQFTLGSGVVTNDVVYYYICAQDMATPPNVSASPSTGAGGFTANPPAAATPPTTPNSYTISQAALTGDYTVGLTMFNQIAGRNITLEKVVTMVKKEVPVEETSVDKPPVEKGKEVVNDGLETQAQITGKTRIVEVEEISWVPIEKGRIYDGPLYVKREDNPNLDYPDGVNGIYATLTAAIADLNLRGVSGATRLLLNDATYPTETFPLVINVMNINKPTATNTVTIKPNTGVTATISGAAAASRIFAILNSYVTIDGSNVVNGTTRNLSITNTATTTPQVLVIGSTGTTPITNVTVKNCNITNGVTSSSALIISDGAAPGTAGWFNNITIQNNSVNQAYIGIYSIATIATGNGSGLNITGNDLNSATTPVRLCKVYVQGVDGATIANNNIGNDSNGTDASNITGIWFATGTVNSTISGNTISNIYGYGPPRGIAISSAYANANITITGNTITNLKTAYSSPPYGIYVFSTTSGVSVKKNKIGGLLNTNTGGYGARGINIATTISPANIDVVNNFVWNIVATSDASVTYWGIGIAIDATISNVNVYFNTVNLYGTFAGYTSATVHTAFYNSSGATLLNVRDNIFVNSYDNTGSTTDKSYAIYSAAANTAFTDINYCDYYVSGTPGVLGYLGGDQATLTAWKTATGKDQNSISGNPLFFSDSNLHIDSTQVSPVSNAGQYISTVTDDIDGNTRSLTTPDIGADEYNAAGVLPLTLNLKVYLEGFWNGTTQVVDTAMIYIANSTSPYAMVDSQKVVLSNTGTANMNFTKSSGNYYVIVKHRNHLETWSRLPQTFVAGTPLAYDFTTDSAKAYGYNMKKVGSVWTLFAGDANQDGSVDALDVVIFITQFGNLGYLSCDFNGDNSVDALDVQIFIGDFGLTKAVPTLVSTPTDPGAREKKKEEIRKKFDTEMRKINNNLE